MSEEDGGEILLADRTIEKQIWEADGPPLVMNAQLSFLHQSHRTLAILSWPDKFLPPPSLTLLELLSKQQLSCKILRKKGKRKEFLEEIVAENCMHDYLVHTLNNSFMVVVVEKVLEKVGTKWITVSLLLLRYGFGASFDAFFAKLGGGSYTRAVDVGADLVGKVEQRILKNDSRNPAAYVDLVGDNVGYYAARGADLFESIATEIINVMLLGGTMTQLCKIADLSCFVLFPLIIHSFVKVVSSAGKLYISDTHETGIMVLGEDLMTTLQNGYSFTIVFAILEFGLSTLWSLDIEQAPLAWFFYFVWIDW